MTREELRSELFGSGPGPEWGVVLGSGFDGWLDHMSVNKKVFFGEVEDMTPTSVSGHGGYFSAGFVEGKPMIIVVGRLHLYEDLTAAQVVGPVRLLVSMGVSSVFLTTAVGSVDESFVPGDGVVITDQINLTGEDPHTGAGMFPDTSGLYDPVYTEILRQKSLRGVVLAGVRGPSYETPAEVRVLESMGADVVCMSTVLEALALAAAGVRCVAVGVVANRAGSAGLKHDDVLRTVRRSTDSLWPAASTLIASGCE